MVVLCPAVLSGTTSSVVGYDTYERLLKFFQQSEKVCAVFSHVFTLYITIICLLFGNMNYTQLNNDMNFYVQFRIIISK